MTKAYASHKLNFWAKTLRQSLSKGTQNCLCPPTESRALGCLTLKTALNFCFRWTGEQDDLFQDFGSSEPEYFNLDTQNSIRFFTAVADKAVA